MDILVPSPEFMDILLDLALLSSKTPLGRMHHEARDRMNPPQASFSPNTQRRWDRVSPPCGEGQHSSSMRLDNSLLGLNRLTETLTGPRWPARPDRIRETMLSTYLARQCHYRYRS
jgi:hypothetical protein